MQVCLKAECSAYRVHRQKEPEAVVPTNVLLKLACWIKVFDLQHIPKSATKCGSGNDRLCK